MPKQPEVQRKPAHREQDAEPRPDLRQGRRRRLARRIYLALAIAFLGAIIIQVFLAGAGIFSSGANLEHHVAFVEWFQPMPLFLLLMAFLGRMERFAKIAPATAFIALVLQYEFADARPSAVAGLHTINALLLFWLASEMVRRSWKVRPAKAPGQAARTVKT